jgi:hypothetical protein
MSNTKLQNEVDVMIQQFGLVLALYPAPDSFLRKVVSRWAPYKLVQALESAPLVAAWALLAGRVLTEETGT